MLTDSPNQTEEAREITDKTAGDGRILVRRGVCNGCREARKESGRERHIEKTVYLLQIILGPCGLWEKSRGVQLSGP